ncbi:MAG TPA: hypothetical protein VGN32_00520, partial [Ktedonobacterales bacterium]|nr:hypothetical protein [Ktedonobacterales bacterium]
MQASAHERPGSSGRPQHAQTTEQVTEQIRPATGQHSRGHGLLARLGLDANELKAWWTKINN